MFDLPVDPGAQAPPGLDIQGADALEELNGSDRVGGLWSGRWRSQEKTMDHGGQAKTVRPVSPTSVSPGTCGLISKSVSVLKGG